MRGISNVISSIFVLSAILVAAYISISAFIHHTTELVLQATDRMEQAAHAIGVQYGDAECNTMADTIRITYTGDEEEYGARFACMDLANPQNTMCIVPTTSGEKSIQYVDKAIPGEIELNMGACSELETACITRRLVCYAIGVYATRKIYVQPVT